MHKPLLSVYKFIRVVNITRYNILLIQHLFPTHEICFCVFISAAIFYIIKAIITVNKCFP